MRKTLYRKFLIGYILIGILGFILISTAGSYMIEKKLENTISENLYKEATTIASSDTVKHNISSSNLKAVQSALSAIAAYQDSIIWIINNKGEIVLSTRKDIAPDTPIDIEHFDPTKWGNTYYQIGNFYGYFDDTRMSVIAPVTADMETKGYVSIHYLMSDLYQRRSNSVEVMQFVFFILYIILFLFLLLYRHYVNRPLQEISRGASEFANGNLSYRIPISSEDEIGYLGQTLNYMAEKLSTTGEYQRDFIANVSHDFRSPLTSIKGYVEAMLDGTIPSEMQERYLKIIAYESERLEKLTKSLLNLNQVEMQKRMLHLRRFDINEIIKTTAESFEGICTKRKIRLELILSGRELFARADMEQIQQVLYNLLDNAIKFSPDGSSIIMETTEKNDRIFVSVKDHGIGIPKESLPKIWDRFYKTDVSRGRDRKGIGLGLAIVKEIIHSHGQNINVISTEGVGTEFIFTLEKAE